MPENPSDVESSEDDDSDAESRSNTPVRSNLKIHAEDLKVILKRWALETHQSEKDMDTLLKRLHRSKPVAKYDSLPKSGKGLLNLGKDMEEELNNFPVRAMTTQKEVEGENRRAKKQKVSNDASDSDGSSTSSDEDAPQGYYVHLGIENALLGTSPGLYHFEDHIAMLRRCEACSPGILPQFYLELAFGKELATAAALLRVKKKLPAAYFWYNPDHVRPPALLFSLNLHVDGVVVYENTEKAETMPLLASIHEIVPFHPSTGTADKTRGQCSGDMLMRL